MKRPQKGFSLIEIAIVLVIIGLLLGGVMKGQALITQGKIRAAEKEFDGVAVSILSYRERYKAWPGDDTQAAARWTGSTDGDGSGNIDGTFNSTTDSDDSRKIWQHLRAAGLIAGHPTPTQQPANAVGGILGVQTGIADANGTLLDGAVICTTNLPAPIANAIDADQDEGLPNQGSVRGFKQTTGNTPDFTNSIAAYSDDGTTLYTLCKQI